MTISLRSAQNVGIRQMAETYICRATHLSRAVHGLSSIPRWALGGPRLREERPFYFEARDATEPLHGGAEREERIVEPWQQKAHRGELVGSRAPPKLHQEATRAVQVLVSCQK